MSEITSDSIVRTVLEDYDDIVYNNETVNVNDFYYICKGVIASHQFELINHVLIDMISANIFVQIWDQADLVSRDVLQNWFNQGIEITDSNLSNVTQLFFSKLWKLIKQ